MKSRERILNTIYRQPVDRVPISTYELVGHNPLAWENNAPSYKRLMDVIRQGTDCIYMMEPKVIYGGEPMDEVATWREGDTEYCRRTVPVDGKSLESLSKTVDNIHTTWVVDHLCDDLDDVQRYLNQMQMVPQYDYTAFDVQRAQLGDDGIMMISIADPICEMADLLGMTRLLMLSITDTSWMKRLLDQIHERQMATLHNLLIHDLDDVMIRICGPEYATPPYMSPAYFDLFVRDYLVEICALIRHSGAIPRIHSHGRIGAVLDRFAQTEAQVLDPLEPIPDGDISLRDVKALYGDQFCLMGNIELRELEHAQPDRVDELVRLAMDSAKAGGGFILMPTAAPINEPLTPQTEANYLQMIESAHRWGQY